MIAWNFHSSDNVCASKPAGMNIAKLKIAAATRDGLMGGAYF